VVASPALIKDDCAVLDLVSKHYVRKAQSRHARTNNGDHASLSSCLRLGYI
jgi:hypothetical protein